MLRRLSGELGAFRPVATQSDWLPRQAPRAQLLHAATAHVHRCQAVFDRAIEDTIIALNTGCLRSRDGTVLQKASGKAYITNPAWREKLDAIVDLLRAIRSCYDLAVHNGTLHLGHNDGRRQWYCINDHNLAHWMDHTRAQTIGLIGSICKEIGVHPPHGPRHPHW
jgi:hypothetical protein